MAIPKYYPNVKRVNIISENPINITNPPIIGSMDGIEMSTGNILKCLCRRAKVFEVLSNGATVQLTTKNFRNDFESSIKTTVHNEEKKETFVTVETKSLESIKEDENVMSLNDNIETKDTISEMAEVTDNENFNEESIIRSSIEFSRKKKKK